MLVVISPAKTVDFESPSSTTKYSQAEMLDQSEALIEIMSTKSPADIEKLMKISPKLAELNIQRYHNWSRPFRLNNAKQAVMAFKGDVYTGLEADKFTEKQLEYCQDNLRILSGLYGVLRPLDLIQAYRLEMGIKLSNPKGNNLYAYWGDKITNNINKHLQATNSKLLLNVASIEYLKSIDSKTLAAKIITPVFKDWHNGQYKMISFFAKKARGKMAAWVIKNKVKTARKLTQFDLDGYCYSEEDSDELNPVFLRKS